MADPTEIGRPPSGPPTQGRTGGGPSLPPLRQPTGELPVTQSPGPTAAAPAAGPTAGPAEGVFAARPTDAVGQGRALAGYADPDLSDAPLPDDPFTIAEQPSVLSEIGGLNDETGQRPHVSDSGSGLVDEDTNQNMNRDSGRGIDKQATGENATNVMPSFGAAAPGLGAAAAVGGGLEFASDGRSDDSPTNPFPGADSGPSFAANPAADLGSNRRDARQPASAQTSYDPFSDGAGGVGSGSYDADYGAPGAVTTTSDPRQPGSRQPGPNAAKAAAVRGAASAGKPLNAPGAPRRGPGPGSGRPTGAPVTADRLQDTEFKLADKRRAQKPKEPNRLVLALAMALVVLAGVGVAYLLSRDGDAADQLAGGDSAQAEPQPEGAVAEAPAESLPQAEPEPQVDEPTLFFDDAQLGPLEQGTAYGIDLVGEPEGSLLQVVVDDIPQGAPDPLLPDLILPAGRHTLHVNMINGDVVSASTPVDVYVLGDTPVQGHRANLSSVNFQTEGWQEAIRQFDEFRAAGHEGLQLYPITEGYWNIFVQGFGEDRGAVQTYCEGFGLEVPLECFADYFDGAAATAAEDGTTDGTEEDGAMTEEDGAMFEDGNVAEGGASTTTTAGG